MFWLLVSLRNDALELALCPEAGGSIAAFHRRDGFAILRPATEAAIAAREPRGMASFPLLPYSNRIVDGVFAFEGKTYRLPRNFPPEPHSIHGNAWQRPWRLETRENAAAVLRLDHPGDQSWPWRYTARQHFTLTDATLTVVLEVRNEDARPMPFGFGHHPYFQKRPQARLTATVGGVLQNDPAMVPAGHTAVPPAWDLNEGRAIDALRLDNCFTGLSGAARIDFPAEGVGIALSGSPECTFLVVYVPDQFPIFCVEAVSNVNDAFNAAAKGAPDTGMIVLPPGGSHRGWIRFAVTEIPRHGA